MGRILAIGDIHGCDRALDALLDAIAPAADDTVVVLGDVVDRGPDTRRAVELLLDLQDTCQVEFILGNHEEMMLAAIAGLPSGLRYWHAVGGDQTLASYGGRIEDIPDAHLEFLRSGLPYWETDADVFVHAGLEPDLPLSEQPGSALRWDKLTADVQPHRSGKRIVCGHTPQKDGRPVVLDGWVCIDTWACGGQNLTCLETTSDMVFQATDDDVTGPQPLAEAALDGTESAG